MKPFALVAIFSMLPFAAGATTLHETGSSLLFPVAKVWVTHFRATHPDVSITLASTGSGTGVASVLAGQAELGASDSFLTPVQRAQSGALNIAVAQSAQVIVYNVPGVGAEHLRLDPRTLAGIYSRRITRWNDPALSSLNPGVKLPAIPIRTIARSDASGDTALFTAYLSAQVPAWAKAVGSGLSVTWPSAPGQERRGNDGVLAACAKTPGAIAYLGISYLAQANGAGLGYAQLRNRDGRYVLPTVASLAAAIGGVRKVRPSEDVSLIDRPGADAYPITNLEYIIVKAHQQKARRAAAIRAFLSYVIDRKGGNDGGVLIASLFMPLPPNIAALSRAQIQTVR